MFPQIFNFTLSPNAGNTVARYSIRVGDVVVHHMRLARRYDGVFYLGTPSWRLPDNSHINIVEVGPETTAGLVAALVALYERAEVSA